MKCFLLPFLAWTLLPFARAGEGSAPTPAESRIIEYMELGQPTILRVWPEGSPRNHSRSDQPEQGRLTDKLRVYHTGNTSLLVYRPPEGVTRLDSAVIHCPGGGYNYLAMANPQQFARWMNHLGVTVAVLKYHTPRSKQDPDHLDALADAQRALRVMRAHAAQLGLSPDKIGISGASAGGHLGFHACLNQAKAVYEPVDETDQLSCRPAFGLLFYPAYLSDGKQVALHPSLDASKLGSDTPPLFMTINGDDRGFAIGNLAAMVAMHDAKVPSELHVWTAGGHSGCFDKYPLAEFARPAARFLVRHQILPESSLARSDAWLDQVVAKLRPERGAADPKPRSPMQRGLQPDQLSLIEREILRQAGRELTIHRLWPGDGKRVDDPFVAEAEALKDRKVRFASDVTVPSMTYFPATKPDGRGVLVFPGGGYGGLAWDHEGVKVCEWLGEQGIHAFLVKYRTPRREGLDKHHVALQDAQRAIRLVRSRATSYGVAPDQIGVLGFSAGGHLAALVSSPLEGQSYEPIDDHDRVSPKADFAMLIYPAYTTTGMGNDEVDPMLLPKAPGVPTFIAAAADDQYTRGQYFWVARHLQAKTPLAYHVYETGAHGKGIDDGPYAFAQWPRECARWLEDLGR